MLRLTGKKYRREYTEDIYTRVEFHGFIVNVNQKKFIITCYHGVKNCILDSYNLLHKNSVFDIAILSCDSAMDSYTITDVRPKIGSVIRVQYNSGTLIGIHINRTNKLPRLEYKCQIAVKPGISGSPVFNDSGQIIGMLVRANSNMAYCVPAYSILYYLRTLVMGRAYYTELYKNLVYAPAQHTDIGVLVTDSALDWIQVGDIITHINSLAIHKNGNIDMYICDDIPVPFWFALYHQIPGNILSVKLVRNSAIHTYTKFVKHIIPPPKIRYLCIGPYVMQPLKKSILSKFDRASEMLLNFVTYYHKRIMITLVIGPNQQHKFQIVTSFNNVDVQNIDHLNYLYLNNHSRIITLKLLNGHITLDYTDSLRDAHDIYSTLTLN